jgi:hypothetical protein
VLGLGDLNWVVILDSQGKEQHNVCIEQPSDIHVVHSKLIVRNDKAIWYADPGTD